MQFSILQVHPEEIIEETAKLSNGDVKTPSTARLERADDMGSSSSLGTVQAQSGRGHERVDSFESVYRYWHPLASESSSAITRIELDFC
jgi:hypothetical protein